MPTQMPAAMASRPGRARRASCRPPMATTRPALKARFARVPRATATTACWPVASVRRAAIVRPAMSVGPPAANGTSTRIGRAGQFWARAAPLASNASAQAARRAPAPTNQRVPSKDRYAEIQQALADAGHFTGEANGVWNQESIEAMKAFQAAQGFEPTGKVDSRILIKLGLGPKYDTVSSDSSSVPSDPRQPG